MTNKIGASWSYAKSDEYLNTKEPAHCEIVGIGTDVVILSASPSGAGREIKTRLTRSDLLDLLVQMEALVERKRKGNDK